MAVPGKLEVLTSGKASFEDFVQPYDDQVLGKMMREAMLKEALKRGS